MRNEKLLSIILSTTLLSGMTADNSGNIYYIEKSDNCVYKLDTSSGKKTKIFDIEKLSLQKTEKQEVDTEEEVTETVTDEETGEEKEVKKTVTKTVTEDVVVKEYSKYEPYQLKYDTGVDKLIVSGCYTVLERPYQPISSEKHYVIYDISKKTGEVFCEDALSYGVALNSNVFQIFDYVPNLDKGIYNLDIESGNKTLTNDDLWNWDDITKTVGEKWFKSGNGVYRFCKRFNSEAYLLKYDFSSSEYKNVANGKLADANSIAQNGSNLYFWYKDEFSKMSVSDGKISKLDINTKSENVEFADMGSMKNISETFFVIDDNKIILYDKGMKAFRLLQKNK